ncbi:MAG: hypothetical protein ABIH65_02235 [Nanoarchaeota archaeon]
MSVLEQVIEQMNNGISEDEIASSLREQGVSPDSITEALGQAKIKTAISSEDMNEYNGDVEPSIMRPGRAESLPTEGEISDEDLTPPSPSTFQAQREGLPLHRDVTEEYVPTEEYYSPTQQYQQPEYAPQYQQPEYIQQQPEYGYPSQTTDTDTMIEIAEQVFSEKIKSIQKHIEDLNELKTLMQSKVENISDRLKRIEVNIDRLQAEILEKVGSYGRGLDNVQKEMSMMQDSFGKMVSGLTDKAEHKHHTTSQHTTPTHYKHHATPSHTIHHIKKKTTVIHKSGKKHSKKR